jgi:hypothetical protein
LFGATTSSLALISFIQQVSGAHLLPSYATGFYAYHEAMNSFIGWLYAPFVFLLEWIASRFHFSPQLSVPTWWRDLAAFSLLITSVFFRAGIIATGEGVRFLWYQRNIIVPLALLFYGLTLVGPVVIFATVYISFSSNYGGASLVKRMVRDCVLSFLAVAVAAIVFFVTNAYPI